MESDAIYIYGIIDGRLKGRIGQNGVGNREVFPIHFKDITAIASNTRFMEYDPNEANTLAHENVIQEVLKQDLTIAPMRFCTIVRTRDDAMRLLQSAYLPFKRNILKIRDKLEFDVKAFLDIEGLREEITDDDALVERSRDIAVNLNVKLKGISDDLVLEEQITEDMIMNASFLVHKARVKEFYEEISDFDRQFTDKLKIRISGPTAPYNFVEMPVR